MTSNDHRHLEIDEDLKIVDKDRMVAAAKKFLESGAPRPKRFEEKVRAALTRDAERAPGVLNKGTEPQPQPSRFTDFYREISDNHLIGCAAAGASRYGLVSNDQAISDDINRAIAVKLRADRERNRQRADRAVQREQSALQAKARTERHRSHEIGGRGR